MYLGNEYSLKIKFSPFLKRISVRIIGKELVVCMREYNKERLRKAIELWYREEGVRIIKDRVEHYLKFYPVKPRSIKVKSKREDGVAVHIIMIYFLIGDASWHL